MNEEGATVRQVMEELDRMCYKCRHSKGQVMLTSTDCPVVFCREKGVIMPADRSEHVCGSFDEEEASSGRQQA